MFSACLSFRPLSWSLLVIFYRISTKFHIWIASIKLLFKFEYVFCPTKDNQNGRRLSVSTVVVTLSHFNWISFKFHKWIAFIKLLFKFGYGICHTIDNEDG